MSENKKAVNIVLDIFSGRPNPNWKLSKDEIEELQDKLKSLPETKTKILQPQRLGDYRGFLIKNPSKISGIPEGIQVHRKTVSFKEKKKVLFYDDINNIEDWLFKQATEKGHEKLVERIQTRLKLEEKENNF